MKELLDNIDSLIVNHYTYKTKRVIWRDDVTEQFVKETAENVTDDIYEYVSEKLGEADKEIDEAIKTMEEEWEENPLSRKDFNVFMLKNKNRGD